MSCTSLDYTHHTYGHRLTVGKIFHVLTTETNAVVTFFGVLNKSF
jgi:hypothetical protein